MATPNFSFSVVNLYLIGARNMETYVIKKLCALMEMEQSLTCSEKFAVCSFCPLYMDCFMLPVSFFCSSSLFEF